MEEKTAPRTYSEDEIEEAIKQAVEKTMEVDHRIFEQQKERDAGIIRNSAIAAVVTCVFVSKPISHDNQFFLFALSAGYAVWHAILGAKRNSGLFVLWSVVMLVFATVQFVKTR